MLDRSIVLFVTIMHSTMEISQYDHFATYVDILIVPDWSWFILSYCHATLYGVSLSYWAKVKLFQCVARDFSCGGSHCLVVCLCCRV